uniref:Protochlorophyllide reductase n=1 Tax=Chaetoceros debilis TaxID=122233 RepID=A0A7S3Q2I5_9STRA|mmetsp:Transcript_14378/g.21408  ORF Transcript_14378/g.21408 Transcript_14378/m.21408 type:complete len:486 (-) Transcript_14378:16-1473(-)
MTEKECFPIHYSATKIMTVKFFILKFAIMTTFGMIQQTHAWSTGTIDCLRNVLSLQHQSFPGRNRRTSKHSAYDYADKNGNSMTTCMVSSSKASEIFEGDVVSESVSVCNDPNKPFNPLPNFMLGKTVIITGAASGLGLESAKRMSAAGANIVLTARSIDKSNWAVDAVNEYLNEIEISSATDAECQHGHVIGIELELEDLNSVKTFSKRYKEKLINIPSTITFKEQIDVLMNNAGLGGMPTREFTIDGFERTFQSNHLGHFVLTHTLFPYFNRDVNDKYDGCRVINVSSLAHESARLANSKVSGIDIDNIVMADKEYSNYGPYQQTKLANVLFTQELQRRANAAGMKEWFTTVSMEPGIVATDIWRYTLGKDPRSNPRGDNDVWSAVERSSSTVPGGKIVQWLARNIFYRAFTKTEIGANTQIYLASAPNNRCERTQSTIEGGKHYGWDMQMKELDDFAQDKEKALELWTISEECAGIKFTPHR